MVESAAHDLQLALRRWRRRPTSSLVVMVVLALGIGLSGAVFSAAWGTMWRGLASDHGQQLVRMAIAAPGQPDNQASLPLNAYETFRDSSRSCEKVGAWLALAVDVDGLDRYPEKINGAMVTAETLGLLGVRPLLGRFFTPDEERSRSPVVIVGERLWREQLGGTRNALGRSIRVYHQPMTVIGVVAEGVRAPYNQEVWFPLDRDVATNSPWLQAVALPFPNTAPRHIEAELTLIARAQGDGYRAIADAYESAYVSPQLRRSLLLGLLAVSGVLLVACANAAGLFLAQGLERRGELAIRHALGAQRGRLLRQLLTEALALTTGAAALGTMLAQIGIWLYQQAGPVQGPYWIDVRLDPVVMTFLFTVALVIGCLAGGLPAWRLAREGADLRAGRGVATQRGTRRRLSLLIALQVALSTTLIAGTWWMVQTAEEMSAPYEILNREDLLTFRMSIYGSPHAKTPEDSFIFWQQALIELEKIPGVESVAIAPTVKPRRGGVSVIVDGRQETAAAPIQAHTSLISPGAFEALGVQPILGRELRADEAKAGDVVIVDRLFADTHLGVEPVGQRIRFGADQPWRRVVGVVPSLPWGTPGDETPSIYVPAHSSRVSGHTFVMHTRSDAATMGLPTRTAIARVDDTIGLERLEPMSHWVDLELRHVTRVHTLLLVFAGAALLLTTAGLYSVLSLGVGSRQRELAIRQALGATANELGHDVMATSLKLVATAGALGLISGWWAISLLAKTFGSQVNAAAVLAPTLGTVAGLAVIAALVPALRARAVDPALALHDE